MACRPQELETNTSCMRRATTSDSSPGCCREARLEVWCGRRTTNKHCWALMHCDCSKQLTHGLGSSLPTPISHQTQSRPAHSRIPINLTLYVRSSHPWQAEAKRIVSSNYIYIMHRCSLLCYKPHNCPRSVQQLVHQGNFTMQSQKNQGQRLATLLAAHFPVL